MVFYCRLQKKRSNSSKNQIYCYVSLDSPATAAIGKMNWTSLNRRLLLALQSFWKIYYIWFQSTPLGFTISFRQLHISTRFSTFPLENGEKWCLPSLPIHTDPPTKKTLLFHSIILTYRCITFSQLTASSYTNTMYIKLSGFPLRIVGSNNVCTSYPSVDVIVFPFRFEFTPLRPIYNRIHTNLYVSLVE